ncbi:c-type cytochrome biogenesis protein CcmI [Jinshanibacter sp. LJY008]|uniref:C-type cytochrome biogenesis protein CcmI n=1 Tax=Limnobaculum eriocheiris TaxID=2897391 RepID=A0A9X1MU63_9GAMM|nr:c-type cytochrome biogenesis protein CcmI [Limnobaculum eriocheiris]MCD1125656.1 c-type cytochrome biogenesis protein CcmI [Limnobaculum eriocheiris]
MMIFWSGAGLMLCLILLIIWLPVIRSTIPTVSDRDLRNDTNLALYQQQVVLAGKLFSEQEKVNGLSDEFQQELSLSLLQNMAPVEKTAVAISNQTSKIIPAVMTAIVILVTAVGYGYVGQYQASVQYSRENHTDPFSGMDVSQIQDKVVTELQQRIRQSPGDPEAWFLLGQRYLNSNEFENALIAFDKVTQLRGNDAEVLTAKATTLYYQAGQRMTPQAQTLINQALALEPNQVTALMLLASDHFLNAQYSQAIDIWQQLLDSNNPQINRAKLIEAINMARMMK